MSNAQTPSAMNVYTATKTFSFNTVSIANLETQFVPYTRNEVTTVQDLNEVVKYLRRNMGVRFYKNGAEVLEMVEYKMNANREVYIELGNGFTIEFTQK